MFAGYSSNFAVESIGQVSMMKGLYSSNCSATIKAMLIAFSFQWQLFYCPSHFLFEISFILLLAQVV